MIRVKFSNKPKATIYEVDEVLVKNGIKTPRTTLLGKITIIKFDGSSKMWSQNRYDTGRFPIFI